jgi:uncharacterized membrane protein
MVEPLGKQEAQQRVDRIHSFQRELEQLTGEGVLLLSDEQRTRLGGHLEQTLADLARRFDVDVSESQKQISIAMRIASALGGLALCAAVVLFFYRYWGVLSIPLQVGILIAIPILLSIVIELVFRREKALYYTSLLAIVLFASFVLDLSMIGFIFNMTPSENACLAWGLFALLLAYRYRMHLQLAAGLVLLVVYLAAVVIILCGGSFIGLMDRPETFLPGGLALLAIPLILRHEKYPGFPSVYRLFGLLFLSLTLLDLGNLGQFSFLPLAKGTVEDLYQMIGFAVSILAIWIGVRRRLNECINLGAAFFALFLFIRLFDWWWDWMPRYLFFLIIGIIALALLAVFRKIRAGSGRMAAA